MEEVQLITSIIQDIGISAVFAYLYVSERNSHNETRRAYLADMREQAAIRQAVERNNVSANTN